MSARRATLRRHAASVHRRDATGRRPTDEAAVARATEHDRQEAAEVVVRDRQSRVDHDPLATVAAVAAGHATVRQAPIHRARRPTVKHLQHPSNSNL